MTDIYRLELPDIRVRDPSVLKGTFIHLDIIDNGLVITVDYDHIQFALVTVLRLLGMEVDQSFKVSKKMMEQKEFTLTEIEKRNLDMEEWGKIKEIMEKFKNEQSK